MDIKYEQLEQHLSKGLQAVYLIASDEALLLQESCEKIIEYAKQAGHTEKETLSAEKGFQWQRLLDANASMSLFGEKKIIDLRIPNGKPDKAGSDALLTYLEHLNTDNILLIRCPQLNKQSQNSKWVKAIKEAGGFCLIWKVKAAQLPSWIQKRARQLKLILDHEAAHILAERVEGNLLAASQELEKLALLFPENSQLHSKHILQTVASNSRYDVFTMMEVTLAGNAKKALHMLRGLREERIDLSVIAWAIRNELDVLFTLAEKSREQSLGQSFQELRIWQSKQAMYSNALKRLPIKTLENHMMKMALLDKTIKGRAPGSAENLCEELLLEIAGTRIPV